VCKNGGTFGFVNSYGGFGRKYVPGFKQRADRMAATGLYEDGQKGIRRLTEPDLRLQDQDLDGVQAEILYGIIGAYTVLKDAEAATEMYRIYNDWLVDFCNTHPQRLIGLASLPPGNIAAAVAEVRRVARLGLRGLEFPTTHDMRPLWDSGWEPLWAAVNDVGLPLHFHWSVWPCRPWWW
jgi:predicted TIM-barrel fold metal-dependent hydrolase